MTQLITNNSADVFIKAYRSFLQTTGEMKINQFEKLYRQIVPAMHKKVNSNEIDISTFVYAYMRLPNVISKIEKIILAQTDEIFYKNNYVIDNWQKVKAVARRRKMYFDDQSTLAVIINSVSDVDDLIAILTALQIEWNKIKVKLDKTEIVKENLKQIQIILAISDENWLSLNKITDNNIIDLLLTIQSKAMDIKITQLQGSYIEYMRAVNKWYANIIDQSLFKNINSKKVYFVSSNNHSIVNTITGWVNNKEEELIKFINEQKMLQYIDYWNQIKNQTLPGTAENFLWYILKKYEKVKPEIKKERIGYERKLGIDYIPAKDYLDINTQIIPIKALCQSNLADKFNLDKDKLSKNESLIINIDYPLGFGAYMILSSLLQRISNIKGVYILGKAAFLHGSIGDIALPSTVYDNLTENTFIFKNVFDESYFTEFKTGSILANQNAVSVKGTLLNSEEIIEGYMKNGYTIVEMENGSYLNAIYETSSYSVFPKKETINLVNSPIDIGIINYASDTPFTQDITLGTRNLGYDGVEATYTASLAILNHISKLF